MRPITVTAGPMPAGASAPNAIASGIPTGVGPLQLPLVGIPAGGTNTSAWTGTAQITNNLLTVVSTTTGAMGPGRLSGNGLPPDLFVTGPGPSAGTWLLNRAIQAPTVNQSMRVGTVITLDAPRNLQATSTSDPLGANSYTIYGTDASGRQIQETLVSNGGGPPMITMQAFATVYQVVVANGLGNTINIGTSATAISPWVMFDPYTDVASLTKSVSISGTPTWTIQFTNDDPNSPTNPVPASLMSWVNDPDTTNFASQTTARVGAQAWVPLWARLLLTSASPAGSSATATFVQQG